MKGVLITDMEMPEHCGYCRFRYDGICHALQKTQYSKTDCPLVSVPQQCKYWDSESNCCALHRPSAQQERNVSERNAGEWDMFELITSTWYGKQYYFKESSGIVYSRASDKYMSVDEAIREFLDAIGDNG